MKSVTLNLPDEILQRPIPLAAARGVTFEVLMQELDQAIIVADDAEAGFSALAATSDRSHALAILHRLDRDDLAP